MTVKKSTYIRRQEIVQAALKLIGSGGIRPLTVAGIAKTAGMCEANIYRHFSSKDEVYFAIADFIAAAVMGRAAGVAAGSLRAVVKLETIFSAHMALIAEHPGLPRFIFSEDIRFGNRRLDAKISKHLKSYVETLAGVIAAGIEEGDFREGIQPLETARTLLGIIQSTAYRWTNDQSAFDIEKEGEKLWSNFAKLVGA